MWIVRLVLQSRDLVMTLFDTTNVKQDREGLLSSDPFLAYDWNRPTEEYSWPIDERQPFRAIVKELVRNKTNFTKSEEMREDLRTLQSIGVLVQDIHKDNYCNGKLVDFSLCWTPPHILVDFTVRSEKEIHEEMGAVLSAFDHMVEAEGADTRAKVAAKSEKRKRNEDSELIESVETDQDVRIVSDRLRRVTKKPERLGFSKA